MRVIRARLEGPDAEPGRVPAADVARLILGLERAIARAAYSVLGQQWRGTGRHRQAVEDASTLRFIGVEGGSFVELLALPDSEPTEDEFPITVADLSTMAFNRVLDAITGDTLEVDPELADALSKLSSELGIGDRNTALVLSAMPEPGRSQPLREATIDRTARRRFLDASAALPTTRDETLVGVLYEADFEQNTAKLRLANNATVIVNFGRNLSDSIHDALRSRAGFEGVVHYHPKTSQATNVEVRAVIRSTQLALDATVFMRHKTFAELQAEQGTTGRVSPADLAIPDLTDDERAAFLAEFTG